MFITPNCILPSSSKLSHGQSFPETSSH
jgi:hypothetical protein